MLRSSLLAAACVALLSAPLSPACAQAARTRAASVASVVIVPAGATLRGGQQVTFTARALDRGGSVIPGVRISWSSSKKSVVAITRDTGLATAAKTGIATITVHAKGKSARATVAVVGTPAGGGSYVASALAQVNHVMVDDEFAYWTEFGRAGTRVRKTPLAGGPIYDLAVEPIRDKRGVGVTYAQLQKIGSTVYFSRETRGFFDHWSIRAVSREGGPSTQILGEDAGIVPMLFTGWRTVGQFIVVSLAQPTRIGLPKGTRVAAYNTDTRAWAPLIQDGFRDGRVFLLASDGTSVFVRAQTDGGDVRIVRMAPDAAVNAFTTLFSKAGDDQDLSQQGAADGTNVYYWSRGADGTHRLFSLPVGGGTPAQLLSGSFGRALTTDGTNLFFAKDGVTILKAPVTGGTPAQVQPAVFFASTLGDLAQDATGLFVVKQDSATRWSILRVSK